MLTRKTAVLFALVLASAGAGAATSRTASAAPCHNGGGCSISGGRHYGGGGGGTGGGGGGGGGGANTGPGMGCPTNQGPQIICAPGQAAPAPPPVVPAVDIAESARDQIILPAPRIHTAPAGRTYVQLKTGLWVDQADYAPASITLTITGETVTATANPVQVTWQMGEGTVQCDGPGTPGGTTCGYTYDRSSASQPGGAYRISATVQWNVTWQCTPAGVCTQAGGTLAPMTMTTATPLQVGEVQTESNRN